MGRMAIYDLQKHKYSLVADPHKNEIFSFTVTHDYTMLVTCSRDGTAKLINPHTL